MPTEADIVRRKCLARREAKYKAMVEEPSVRTWAATHKPYSDDVLPVLGEREDARDYSR